MDASVLFSGQDKNNTLLQSKLLHQLEPLKDARWDDFLKRHARSSVFHTVEWLEALRRTYGYEPIAITTCLPGADLQNAALFCRVESWMTGRRLVSVPFSDHCDLLVDAPADLAAIVRALEPRQQTVRYVEIRPRHSLEGASVGSHSTFSYCLHQLDLRPDLDTLFNDCHKDSTQRKIRRAAREGLICEEGRSESLLDSFYGLMLLTRRRHRIPPQPRRWFQNLIDCFGEALKIRVAVKDKMPIAGMLTLRYKDTLVYKYGCSDATFHHLGGTHFLFWRSIQEAKQDRLCTFDLGRSDWDDEGLITFKDRWGAQRSTLTYMRFSSSLSKRGRMSPGTDWKARAARTVLGHMPDRILRSAGELIYKHIG
ncbi:MAG: peptidoglycan bridge formation glycyltransferase FemA/FemB family protein [Acidobacteriia bacterium]|nr:peptidoglycan bridge formation glycyltransferase FemA/FemB family protein [Terriglobia bacterium]